MAAALTVTNIPINGMGTSQQIFSEDAAQVREQTWTGQHFPEVSMSPWHCWPVLGKSWHGQKEGAGNLFPGQGPATVLK